MISSLVCRVIVEEIAHVSATGPLTRIKRNWKLEHSTEVAANFVTCTFFVTLYYSFREIRAALPG